LKAKFSTDECLDITEDHIGSFHCNYGSLLDNYLGKLSDFDSECIQLQYQPHNIIELGNKNIVVSSYDNNLLALYDPSFNLIRKLTEIQSDRFYGDEYPPTSPEIKPDGLACSVDGDVFMTSWSQDTLYKLNSQLEVVKSHLSDYQDYYTDIDVYEDRLYACVNIKDRIDVFDLNLKPVSKHYIGVLPFQIKVIKDRACVRIIDSNSQFKTYFYRLPSFELITKSYIYGPMFVHDDVFYVNNHDGSSLTAFDKNGHTIGEKKTDYEPTDYNHGRGMNYIGGHLLVCSNQKIYKIKASNHSR
jgi:hypothetical protein